MESETAYDVVDLLNQVLEKALEQKSQEKKNEKTRHWAVVFTETEKVLAYVETFLMPKEVGGSE